MSSSIGFVGCNKLVAVLDSSKEKTRREVPENKLETLGCSSDETFHKGTSLNILVKYCHEIKQGGR